MAHVKVNLSLEESVAAAMRRLAADEGKPVSRYLARLVREDERRRLDDLAAEGYGWADEQAPDFAETAMPLATEVWPEWKDA